MGNQTQWANIIVFVLFLTGTEHGRDLLEFSVPGLNNTGKAQALGVSVNRGKGTLEALVEYGMEVLPINIQVC